MMETITQVTLRATLDEIISVAARAGCNVLLTAEQAAC
jgi:hypothetical protein